jgi:hypothetical protein
MKSKTSYKKILEQARSMRSTAVSAIYDRVKLLDEAVFNDADFRADIGNADDFKAGEYLNEFLDDVAYTFLQLRAILTAFPDRAQWEGKSLGELRGATLQQHAEHQPEPAKVTRRTVTIKEHEKAIEEAAKQTARAKHYETMLVETRQSYDELLKENRELRHQLSVAEGRIVELERLVGRDLQAA